jgi:hypothetical protein
VLVATDIAARGIYWPITRCYQLWFPNIPETYVHRLVVLDVLEMVVLHLFVAYIPTGKTFKTYKSRCKTVVIINIIGILEVLNCRQVKNSNRSGGAHKSRKSKFLNKIKIDLVYKHKKRLLFW